MQKTQQEIIARKMAMRKSWNDKLASNGIYVPHQSGIYYFTRTETIKYAYIGQAVDLNNRVIDHLIEHKQHIDNSLYSRKLYDFEKNRGGWQITYQKCDRTELNELERAEIQKFIDNGYILYNITSGGQDAGKTDINQRKEPKGYKKGVEYGRRKALEEVAVYFEKYLDFNIKDKTTKIKERKMQEFIELLKGGAK